MKIRILAVSVLLTMLLVCLVPAGQAVTGGNTVLLDLSKDTSMSYIIGKLYVTGSGGTAAGYNPAQSVYNNEQKVTNANPKPSAVQTMINEAYNKVLSISNDLVSRGASGSIANPNTSSEATEYNSRTTVVYTCIIENNVELLVNEADSNDRKTKDQLLAAYPFDSYSASAIRDLPVGDSVQITAGEYGRETTYTVSAEGSVEGYSITVTNDGNGTGTPSSTAALRDDEITLTATPNSGYQFKEWQVISGTVTVTKNRFTVGVENVEIKAIFEKASDSGQPSSGQQLPQQEQPQEQPQQQQQEDPPTGQQQPQEEQPQTEAQQGQQEQQESDERITFSKLKKAKLKAVSKKKIKVSWKKLSKKVRKEVSKIQIQVSTDPEFKTILKEKYVSSKKTSYTVGGLKKNTKYYIRIRAYTEKDGLKYVSEWVTKSKKTKKK